jgi:tRNA dimethylallyltransferase
MNVTFVVGPTASGKSALALRLARETQGVIVNCDSVQVYKYVEIGAAKPTAEELQMVPHFLYGYVAPPRECTAGDYARDFFAQMQILEQQGFPEVFVVGGTGFYFQAIEKGMYEVEKTPSALSEELRSIAATPEGLLGLYQELKAQDPASAARIHPNDQYRVVRAVEILRSTGQKPSDLRREKAQASSAFPYPLKKMGVWWERPQLHERIHRRVRRMLQSGLIEEVEQLHKMGLQSWAPLQSVGYKETLAYLRGEIKSREGLEEQILISTRQLAKRQVTWFKRDLAIQWITDSTI